MYKTGQERYGRKPNKNSIYIGNSPSVSISQSVSYDGVRLNWNWSLDKEFYPNWNEFVSYLADRGIRMLNYINPRLTYHDGTSDNSFSRRDLFNEAKSNGYLIMNQNDTVYYQKSGSIKFATVDFTNSEARHWYASVIKDELVKNAGSSGERILFEVVICDILKFHILGWMADFGEGIPFDAKLSGGKIGSEVHNSFGEIWAEVNALAVREAEDELEVEKGSLVYFHRNAWTRSNKAGAMLYWMGDQMTTWDKYDGMHSALIGMISGGISGRSLAHR